MDHVAGLAPGNGHLERGQHELGPHELGPHELGPQMRLHRPADDLAAEHVEHGGQVQEPGPGRDVGDVGHAELVRSLRFELALHEVGRRASPLVAQRRRDEAPPGYAAQALRSHEPSHTISPDRGSRLAKLSPHAGNPVRRARGRVSRG
jgi:hypothetical protein